MRDARTDNLPNPRCAAHQRRADKCGYCARDARIAELEAALRWLVGDGVIEIWEYNNDVEVWSESDWERVPAPNDIARTLVEFSKNGTP